MIPQKSLVIAALVLGSMTSPLLAQPQAPAAIQQLEGNQRFREQQSLASPTNSLRVPELYTGENEDVGPQRILKMKPVRTYFDVTADSQYYFTDNTFLTDRNKKSTAIAVNTLQVALAPTPYEIGENSLAPVLGFRSQWYNYGLDGANDNLDQLNFNAQTFFAGTHYIFDKNWRASLTFDYTRLLDQDNYQEFYREYVPAVGLQRAIPISDHLAGSVEFRSAFHFTRVDPFPRSDVNDRLDNSLTFSISYLIVPKLVVSPYYQFTYYYYPQTAFGDDRHDFLNTVGVSLAYYFDPKIYARIFVNGDFRNSNDSRAQEYQKFDTGIELTLNFRF